MDSDEDCNRVLSHLAAGRRARQLSLTLDMPQQPDAMTITHADGTTLYSGHVDDAHA
jgi:hypothetical protein